LRGRGSADELDSSAAQIVADLARHN
jgi:hypothetical protein